MTIQMEDIEVDEKELNNNPPETERTICSSCGQLIDPYFHTCPGMNKYLFESVYKD